MGLTLETATFAGGCFWCTEAIFKRVDGVIKVVSGYAGGTIADPTYEQVSSQEAGATEALQITFDPGIISYSKLLEIFFKTHDPTSVDKQGADTGSQYRSIVFFHTKRQKEATDEMIKRLTVAKVFGGKIVTEVKPFERFSEAEAYHKDFYDRNKDNSYCSVVINPKLEKLYREFPDELKK